MEEHFFDFLANSLKTVAENTDPRTTAAAFGITSIIAVVGLYLFTTPSTPKTTLSETAPDNVSDTVASDTSDEA